MWFLCWHVLLKPTGLDDFRTEEDAGVNEAAGHTYFSVSVYTGKHVCHVRVDLIGHGVMARLTDHLNHTELGHLDHTPVN